MADFQPNMTLPEAGITPVECEMPTEPDDTGADHGIPDTVFEPDTTSPLAHMRAKRALALKASLGHTIVVPRAEWGARAPKGAYQKLGAGSSITLHYEGPHMGSFEHNTCDDKLRTIQSYHMDSNALARGGAIDIAYNAVVCPHGFLFQGRWYNNRSAAQGTEAGNSTSYAICYLAGVNDPLTDAAKAAFLDAIVLFKANAHASAETKVHSDWHATGCPGDFVREWERANCPPPPGYANMPDPAAPQPSPNGGVVLATALPDAIGFIDDPTSDGGWLVTKAGAIYTKDPAKFYGSLGGITLNAPIAAFMPTPTGQGYWLFGEDGGVFSFGDAPFVGAYAKFADEYRAGIHRLAGVYFRGDKGVPSSWRYSYVSNKLESYDI